MFIFLEAEIFGFFKTQRSCHPLYLFLAKEARKRIPLLSGLARGLVFKRFWADELLCHPERSRRTASGSTIYNEILCAGFDFAQPDKNEHHTIK